MLHVLLIEDHPADVLLFREGMQRSQTPADVVIAYDGEQGLKLLKDLHFDLVILDLNLPKVDGYTILRQLQKIEGLPPVLVFSGSQNPKDKETALALGARDYIVKPLEFQGFMRTVQEILNRFALLVATNHNL
jgi:DNA-binding response OmpR family regulator